MSRADRGVTDPAVTIADGSAEIGAASAPAEATDVWLVRYDPRTLEVQVRRGENAGKLLPHKNIVREMVRLGGWNGQAERFKLPTDDSGLSATCRCTGHRLASAIAIARFSNFFVSLSSSGACPESSILERPSVVNSATNGITLLPPSH
jgi:hypothetical protein